MSKHLVQIFWVVSLVVLVGCGKDNDAQTSGSNNGGGDYSGQYDYNIMGCKTGVQTYNSKEEHCSKLKDDALNHYCAADIRAEEYRRLCTTAKRAQAASANGQSMPAQSGSTMQPIVNPEPHTTRPNSSAFPTDVSVIGKLGSRAQVRTSAVSGSIMTTLEGQFEASRNIGENFSIELTSASRAQFSGMTSECILSVRSFTMIQTGESRVVFTLSGIDSQSNLNSSGSCHTVLQNYARSGFQARFHGAYLTSPTAGMSKANVSLSVF